MKVRAKMPKGGEEMYGVGYYEHRLFRGGEEFELSDPKHFSETWMEKVFGYDTASAAVDVKGKKEKVTKE